MCYIIISKIKKESDINTSVINVLWYYCKNAKKRVENIINLIYDGEILEGNFQNKQLKLLLAWISIHEDELNAKCRMLNEGEGYFKIEPLR